MSSASRYLFRVSSFALSANPRGSKSPTGARAPGMVSMVNEGAAGAATAAFLPKLKALREVEVLAAIAGADGVNAAAELTRTEAMASFMIIVLFKLLGESKLSC